MRIDALLAEYAAGCEYVAHLESLDVVITTAAFSIGVAVMGGFSALLLARPQIAENRKAANVLTVGTMLVMLLLVAGWALYHGRCLRIQTVTERRLMEIEQAPRMKTRTLVRLHALLSESRLRRSGWLVAGALFGFVVVYCLALRKAVGHRRPAKASVDAGTVPNNT